MDIDLNKLSLEDCIYLFNKKLVHLNLREIRIRLLYKDKELHLSSIDNLNNRYTLNLISDASNINLLFDKELVNVFHSHKTSNGDDSKTNSFTYMFGLTKPDPKDNMEGLVLVLFYIINMLDNLHML